MRRPSCDSGVPRNTRNDMSIRGNVFEDLLKDIPKNSPKIRRIWRHHLWPERIRQGNHLEEELSREPMNTIPIYLVFTGKQDLKVMRVEITIHWWLEFKTMPVDLGLSGISNTGNVIAFMCNCSPERSDLLRPIWILWWTEMSFFTSPSTWRCARWRSLVNPLYGEKV